MYSSLAMAYGVFLRFAVAFALLAFDFGAASALAFPFALAFGLQATLLAISLGNVFCFEAASRRCLCGLRGAAHHSPFKSAAAAKASLSPIGFSDHACITCHKWRHCHAPHAARVLAPQESWRGPSASPGAVEPELYSASQLVFPYMHRSHNTVDT